MGLGVWGTEGGRCLLGPDQGVTTAGRERSGLGKIGSIARQHQWLGDFGGGARVRAWDGGREKEPGVDSCR